MNAIDKCTVVNVKDENGNPTGGGVTGTGLVIKWQNGPLGRDGERSIPNGAFTETVISAVVQRLKFFQESKFKCRENALAIVLLENALYFLEERTKTREQRQVEGTHTV